MHLISELIIDENKIAYNQMLGDSYKLNDTGKEIINLLKEGKSKEEIIETLSKEYDASKDDLFIDVSDFLAKLKIYGLVQ
jgi:hypothetical protein